MKSLINGVASLEICGVKMFKKRVKQSVFPTFEYHYGLKSEYDPLKIGMKPKKYSPSRKSKLTARTISEMLMNWIRVFFKKRASVSSFIVCFRSSFTIISKIAEAKRLTTVIMTDEPTIIVYSIK